MFGFSAERPMFAWLLSHLGPPPPPPRRHFSKNWDYDAQHGAAARLGRLGLGAGNHASSADDALAAAALGGPTPSPADGPGRAVSGTSTSSTSSPAPASRPTADPPARSTSRS